MRLRTTPLCASLRSHHRIIASVRIMFDAAIFNSAFRCSKSRTPSKNSKRENCELIFFEQKNLRGNLLGKYEASGPQFQRVDFESRFFGPRKNHVQILAEEFLNSYASGRFQALYLLSPNQANGVS